MISSVQNVNPVSNIFQQQNFDSKPQEAIKQTQNISDISHIKRPELMTDEESQAVMSEVIGGISENPLDALTVHNGLDLSRVMALLADD